MEPLEIQDSGFPRLKRKLYEHRWLVGIVVSTYFLFVAPKWDGGSNFGMAAWTCSGAVALVVEIFWAARTTLWFRLALTLVVSVHVAVFCSIHWTRDHYFGSTYREICMIDGSVTFGVMWLGKKIATLANDHGAQDQDEGHILG